MRISSALLLLAGLAACDRASDPAAIERAEAEQRSEAAEAGTIECARGNAALAADCTVDREMGADGQILTVRHPDGAFHRLLVTTDGRGVVAADGAERAIVTVLGEAGIEVRIGGDRYRLPATVKGSKAGG